MIKYDLAITSMVKAPEVAGREGVVTRVYWLLTGTDSVTGRSQEARGSVLLRPPADDAEFTPFAELTESAVLQWLAEDQVIEAYKGRIAKALAATDEPQPENVPPPWAS